MNLLYVALIAVSALISMIMCILSCVSFLLWAGCIKDIEPTSTRTATTTTTPLSSDTIIIGVLHIHDDPPPSPPSSDDDD